MANNPKIITVMNKVSDAQLENIASGGTITKGSDTLTADEGAVYLTPDTSVLYEEQTLTAEQKSQARTNIGAGTSNFDGNYSSLSGAPAIPSKTSDLTNDGDGTSNFATLSDLPTVPSNVSAFNNDSGYITAESDPVFSSSPAAGISSSDISNWNNKLDKVTVANQVYGTDNDGSQTTYAVANSSSTGNAIAKYDSSGRLKAATPDQSDDVANKSYVDGAISNPNLLINGDFQVNQRGASSYNTDNNYTVDRWQLSASSSTVTVTNNTLKLSVGAAITQRFEENSFLDKILTISINVNDDIFSSTFTLSSINGYTIIETFNNGWRCSYSGTGKYIRITNVSGDANDVLKYVKLEIGSIATPLSPRPYVEELIMCQRYYKRFKAEKSYGTIGDGYANSASSAFINLQTPNLRTSPTVSKGGTLSLYSNGADCSVNNISVDQKSSEFTRITFTTSGLTKGYTLNLRGYNDNSAYVDVDAEIY